MTTGKTIALTIWIFVSKVMSLLFNMPSRFVIAFLLRSKRLLILWLQSPSAVTLEPKITETFKKEELNIHANIIERSIKRAQRNLARSSNLRIGGEG